MVATRLSSSVSQGSTGPFHNARMQVAMPCSASRGIVGVPLVFVRVVNRRFQNISHAPTASFVDQLPVHRRDQLAATAARSAVVVSANNGCMCCIMCALHLHVVWEIRGNVDVFSRRAAVGFWVQLRLLSEEGVLLRQEVNAVSTTHETFRSSFSWSRTSLLYPDRGVT